MTFLPAAGASTGFSLGSLGTIGKALSFGSSLFGGGGLFGGDDGPGVQTQINDQRRLENKLRIGSYSDMRKGADILGVHPMVMAGQNPSIGGSISYHSGDNKLAQLGQNAGRAIQQHSEVAQAKELHDAQIERIKAETDMIRSQTTSVNTQPGDSPNPSGDQTVPLWINVKDQRTGKIKRLPNPKAVEGIESAGFPAGTALSAELFGENIGPERGERYKKAVKKKLRKERGNVMRRQYNAQQELINRYYGR
jgi:hypothetical protein